MEIKTILFELLKALCVGVFCLAFYIIYKKALTIANEFFSFLNEKKIKLKDDYKKKLLTKVVRNQISFKPFDKKKMDIYLNSEILSSQEFKNNVVVNENNLK